MFDLGFGDAGKGATVDFLVREREADLVLRFNGGAQAGHTVALPDRRRHTFAQFGAGSFVPGVRTYLGPAFLLHLGGLGVEARRLAALGVSDALERTAVDARAPLISPFQQAAGRLRELLRGASAHGTCGVGVGERVADRDQPDALVAGDLRDPVRVLAALKAQRARKLRELAPAAALAARDSQAALEWDLLGDPSAPARVAEAWADLTPQLWIVSEAEGRQLLAGARGVVCEGAQGVLLDQTWGFHPHTTWSDCTPRGAEDLLQSARDDFRVRRLGVLRSYATRHGAGPFPTHLPRLDRTLREPHNPTGAWQGAFRCGALDLVALRYAVEVSRANSSPGDPFGLAVNCLDRVPPQVEVSCAYEGLEPGAQTRRLAPGAAEDLEARAALTRALDDARPCLERIPRAELCALIERELEVPVWLESYGPQAEDRRWTAAGRASCGEARS